jgi:hypothetical protein
MGMNAMLMTKAERIKSTLRETKKCRKTAARILGSNPHIRASFLDEGGSLLPMKQEETICR